VRSLCLVDFWIFTFVRLQLCGSSSLVILQARDSSAFLRSGIGFSIIFLWISFAILLLEGQIDSTQLFAFLYHSSERKNLSGLCCLGLAKSKFMIPDLLDRLASSFSCWFLLRYFKIFFTDFNFLEISWCGWLTEHCFFNPYINSFWYAIWSIIATKITQWWRNSIGRLQKPKSSLRT